DNELGQVYPTDMHDVDPLDTSGENGNLEHHDHELIEEPDPLVYESKQEVNSLPPELQSISQPQSGLDHPRFQQQRGRGRRGRDQDDSVIQVVSSEREAALEELEPM
ncbi:6770_t:CDS:2, partial [Racocetra fulgida]